MTTNHTPEALEALAAVRIAEANQVLVEAVRADRTAGTTAAMTLVRSADPNFYGFVAAAVDAVTRSGALDAVERDIADYAAQTLAVCAAEPRLRGGVVPRPDWRPVTRFEQRGLNAGRTATDMIYERLA